jgi:hypothetical protein
MMLSCAFIAAPLVHKHFPSHQSAANDYDASCVFVKAEKSSSGAQSQPLLACMCQLLFFIALQPLVSRRTDTAEAVRSIFTRKVQTPRAPPAS